MKENMDMPQKDYDMLKQIVKETEGKNYGVDPNSLENEYQELPNKESSSPDLAMEIFKDINPKGLLLGDLKKNLEKEIGEIKEALHALEQDDLNKELILELKNEILIKNLWITKINNFLMDNGIEDMLQMRSNLN